MGTTISTVTEAYHFVNDDIADPETKKWFLVGSPWACLAILIAYLYFTISFGPRFMAKRQPYNVTRLLQIYNFSQILSCAYIFSKATYLFWYYAHNFQCEPLIPTTTEKGGAVASFMHLYFILKVVDLLDTIFFVLKKNFRQVTFLHLYHHVGMVMTSYMGVKYVPTGHGTVLCVANCFVHMFMYTYYFMTSLNIEATRWKKYLTQLQIAQLVYIFLHFLQIVWSNYCNFPVWPSYLLLPQNIFMIVLFRDFYYKAYVKERKSTAQEGVSADVHNEQQKLE